MTRQKKSSSKPVQTKFTRMPAGVSNPIDIHVGARLRQRRTLLGMSQEKLGDAVELTFQQVQKYERGANRMGASRLFQFGQILDVPVHYFFEGLPSSSLAARRMSENALNDQGQENLECDPMTKRETLELVRAYYAIASPEIRKGVYEMVRSLSKSMDPDK